MNARRMLSRNWAISPGSVSSGETQIIADAGNIEVAAPTGSEWLMQGRKMLARGPADNPEFKIVDAVSRWRKFLRVAMASIQAVGQISFSSGGGGSDSGEEHHHKPVTTASNSGSGGGQRPPADHPPSAPHPAEPSRPTASNPHSSEGPKSAPSAPHSSDAPRSSPAAAPASASARGK